MPDLQPFPQGQAFVNPQDGMLTLASQLYLQNFVEQLNTTLSGLGTAVEAIQAALDAAEAAARETARINSYPSPSSVLSAADAGADASITVADHLRVYPVQGSVDVPDLTITGGTITGLAFSTTYYVYYDDTTLEDEAPAFIATVSLGTASVGAAPGRHFVGKIITPADGAGNTSGTGPQPPGGGGGDYLVP